MLTYNIHTGMLKGSIDGVAITAYAGSGGRAGSKVPGAVNYWLANNPFATGVGGEKSKGTHRYGPLPIARYRLRLHEKRKNWIRLIPESTVQMNGRAGFAIHGRGKVGSHGCIVPTDFSIVLTICKLLENIAKTGKADPVLEVVATGTDVDKKLREWIVTA